MEIGSLRVAVGLDSSGFSQGVARVEAGTRRVSREFSAMDAASRQAGSSLDRLAGAGGIQNVAFQVQDFATQVASGTDASRALAQQLPQLLSGFGAAGAVIGALAAVLIPLGGYFLGAGEAAKESGDAMDDFNAALDRFDDLAKIASASVSELEERYGGFAETVREGARQLAAREVNTALDALDAQLAEYEASIEGAANAYYRLQSAQELVFRAQQPGSGTPAGRLMLLQQTLEMAEQSAIQLADALGLTPERARDLQVALAGINSGGELGETVRNAAEVRTMLLEWYPAAQEMPDVLAIIALGMDEVIKRGAGVITQAEEANIALETGRGLLEGWATYDLGAIFENAKAPLTDLLGMLDTGLSRLQSWGTAAGDWLAGFAAENTGSLVDRIIGVESGGDPSARNPNSSATGLGQFISSTWLRLFKQHFPDQASGMTDAAILALREDAAVSRRMVQLYLQENAALLSRATVPVTDATLYLAHFLGPGGAIDVLRNLAAPLTETVSAGSRASNASVFDDLQTGYDLLEWAQRKVGASTTELAGEVAVATAVNQQAAEAERARAQAEREAEAEAERIARAEAERTARELGLRQDLIAASDRAAQDAEFELSLVGQTADEQARLRTAYELTNQAVANGIDLTETIAGTTQTYGERIAEAADAAGRAAGEQDRLAGAQEAAAEAAQRAAAEMEAFVSSLTGMALGPITRNPIGRFLSTLPGFQAGAESVIGGLVNGGFGGAASALGTALAGAGGGLAGLGTAIGAIAGPVGLVMGLFSALRGQTERLDEGLKLTVRGFDVLVESFEKTRTTRLWGLLTNTDTDVSRAPDEVANPIERAYAQVAGTVRDLARSLGVGASAFRDFSYNITLSLDGLSDEAKERAIAEEFGRISDSLAKTAGVTRRMIREGETATQALERMATALGVANETARAFGWRLFDVSIQGADAASRMIEAAGGLEAFASALDFYRANFFDLGERTTMAARAFADSVRDLGIGTVPRSIEGFRALVDRLMEAGRTEDAGGLLALADDFKALLDLREELAESGDDEAERRRQEQAASEREGLERRLLELQGDTAELRRRELAALDPSNRALQRMIWGLEDARAAMDALEAQDFASQFAFLRASASAANLSAPPLKTAAPKEESPEARELRRELRGLREAQDQDRAVARAMAADLRRLTNVALRWDDDGLPEERVA